MTQCKDNKILDNKVYFGKLVKQKIAPKEFWKAIKAIFY